MSEHDQREDYDDEPDRGPLARKRIVAWPASAMWVLGLMQCIITQFIVAFWTYLFVRIGLDDGKSLRDLLEEVLANEVALIALACWPMATACTVLVMRGANDLRRFQRYPWVVAAAVMTFLSIPFFYLGVLGIPLSLWIFILLLRRDVRARFEAVSRCSTITERSPKFIGATIFKILNTFMRAHNLGYVFGSQTAYRCFGPRKNLVRKPGVSCVMRGRFPGEPKGDISIPPDLAVEVVSPNDLYEAVEIKVGEYLEAGVRLVWVVCPATKSIIVRRPNKTANTLDVNDTLSGEDVLPGFSCSVGEIFS